MPKLTVKDLRDCKGKRQISFVQVTSEDQVRAAAAAGMDMIGTGFRDSTRHFPGLVPNSHFQLGLAYGKHASPEEALRDAFAAMECGAESIYCAMSPAYVEVMARERSRELWMTGERLPTLRRYLVDGLDLFPDRTGTDTCLPIPLQEKAANPNIGG